jgi:hypothetical protein
MLRSAVSYDQLHHPQTDKITKSGSIEHFHCHQVPFMELGWIIVAGLERDASTIAASRQSRSGDDEDTPGLRDGQRRLHGLGEQRLQVA